MNSHNTDRTDRRAIPWHGAAMMAFGYAVFYVSVAYFIDQPISLHWLVWPVLGVAAVTFAVDCKGIGDRPWFIRVLGGLIIAIAVVGVILS